MTRLIATPLAIVFLLAPASALANDGAVAATFDDLVVAGALEAGASLRITYLDPATGTERSQDVRLSSLSSHGIAFEVDGQPGLLPAAAIVRVERRDSRLLRSAGIGALAGAAVLGLLTAAEDDSSWIKPSAGQALAGGALVGGVLGTFAGLIGSHHTTLLEVDRDGIRTGRVATSPMPDPTLQENAHGNAEDAWKVPEERQRRWRLLAWTGFLPGADSSLEQKLESAGFGDTVSCFLFCEGIVDYPTTTADGYPWGLEIGYEIRSKLTISAIAANTRLGNTSGYSGRAGYLRFDRQVRTFAALASWTPTRRLRLGAGPAVNTLRIDSGHSSAGERTTRRLGLLVDGTVDVVQTRVFLLSVKAQYRYVGSMSVGPIESSAGWYGTPAVFGPTEVSFDHFFIGGAIGLRF